MTDETQEIPATDAIVPETETKPADPSPAAVQSSESDELKGVQRRIDELTRYRREAERDRDYWRELAVSKLQAPPPAQVSEEQPKTLADFNYDETAYQKHLFSTAEQRAVRAAEAKMREQMQNEQSRLRAQTFQQRESEFAKDTTDYYVVTRDPAVPISQAMAEAIEDSEDGPALAYHLGKNLDLAARIAALTPASAARELGKIEAKLASEREKAREKAVSKAPPPAPKVEGVDPAMKVNPDDPESDKLSDREWVKMREKQLRKKAS